MCVQCLARCPRSPCLSHARAPFLGMIRLSELKSNVQNSRPIKIATALPDDIITQREDSARAMQDEEQEAADGEQEPVTTEGRLRRRKSARVAEAVTRVEPEEKLRGKRQKDFDISEQNDSSDDEKQRKERTRAAEEAWTQSQQKLLELALQQYPKGASDRWDKIAKCVPSKSKVRGPAEPRPAGCRTLCFIVSLSPATHSPKSG